MAQTRTRVGMYSAAFPNDSSCLVSPNLYPTVGKGTLHAVIGCHGHGGYSYQYEPVSAAMPGFHSMYMADYGNIVTLGVDHAAINAWGDPNALRAMDDAYAWLNGTYLMPTTKVAIMGWSMGGLTALNWALRNPGKIAGMWLWNPASDIRFWENAAAAYTPTYSTSGIAQGSYTTEIDNAFASSSTHSTTGTIPALGGAGITLVMANAKGFSDANVLGGVALPIGTVNAATFTWTSKDDTRLYGCVSTTASTIAVTSGQTVTSTYANQVSAYNPYANAAAFSTANGFTFPIKVSQASDDVTVPPGMNNDATNGFVARTGNANITLRSPAPTGGHSGSISNVPQTEVLAFYQSLSW